MKKCVWVAAIALACAASRFAVANPFDEARALYEDGRYREAQAKLLPAARAGDPQAQELLGFLYAFGPQVYPGVKRDLRAARHWFDLAARGGRPVARYMYCALDQQAAGRPSARYCFDWIVDAVEPGARSIAASRALQE